MQVLKRENMGPHNMLALNYGGFFPPSEDKLITNEA